MTMYTPTITKAHQKHVRALTDEKLTEKVDRWKKHPAVWKEGALSKGEKLIADFMDALWQENEYRFDPCQLVGDPLADELAKL